MSHLAYSRRVLWLLTVIVVLVIADQLLKRRVVQLLGPGATSHRQELLGRALAFEYVENRGSAFGMFASSTLPLLLLSAVIIVVALFVMLHIARHNFSSAVMIALILGGAIGNAIDRMVRGYVIDFVSVGNFWKFNLADAAITIGVTAVLVLAWRSDRQPSPISPDQGIA